VPGLPRWRRAATALGAIGGVVAVVGAAAWIGCSIYDPSLLLPAQQEAGADVAAEASGGHDAAPDVPNPCPELFPPTKPTADDPSDAGDQTVIVALHTIDLGFGGDSGPPPLYGYDLDQIFTGCDGGAESCGAAAPGATHPDEPEGRDNSGGQLLAKLASFDPAQFNSNSISQRLQQGIYSVVLEILHYNGQANDQQVTAALYTSDGIEAVGDAAPPPAKWDGTDVWSIDNASVLIPDASPIVGNFSDGVAYVSGGVLVMHVNFPISLGTSSTGGLSVSLTGGVITGHLVPTGSGTFHMPDGTIAGRWNVSALLLALQNLTVGSLSLCPDGGLYANFKSQICQYSDIMTSASDDRTGKTCDAISLAFSFTADPAQMGDVVAKQLGGSPCGTTPPDDCTKP
jgi:hypothetical protein